MPSTSRWPHVAFLAALALVFVGAGCRKAPDVVLRTAQERAAVATSVRDDIEAVFDVDGPRAGEMKRVHIEIRSRGVTAETPAGETSAESTTSIAFDIEDGSFSVALDQRTIGDVSYLRVTDIGFSRKGTDGPSQAETDAAIGMVKSAIGGQWVRLDPEEIASFAEQFGNANVVLPSTERRHALTRRVREVQRAHPILVLRDDLGSATTDGVRAYHYRVGLDRDALRALVDAAGSALGAKPEEIAKFQLALAEPEFAGFIDRASGEVWIAKRTGDFVRVRFPVDLSGTGVLPTRPDGPSTAITGTVDLHYSDWGKPVTVAAPDQSKTLQEILAGFLGFLPLLQQPER